MATNLRLRPDAEEALRAESARTGKSQQDLIRTAVDVYLRIGSGPTATTEAERLVASSDVLPARSAFRQPAELLRLPPGTASIDLLDRDDRI